MAGKTAAEIDEIRAGLGLDPMGGTTTTPKSGGGLTFGGAQGGSDASIGWANMSPVQRMAHSIKNDTDYQNTVNDPAMYAAALRYLEKDPFPGISNSGDSLAELYAFENTQAQQQEQAASNEYGFSNAQQGMYDDLIGRGRVDANGNLITDGLSRQQLYDLYTGGFGLGDTDAHRRLKQQAYEAFSAMEAPQGQIVLDGAGGGLTFGGGSVTDDSGDDNQGGGDNSQGGGDNNQGGGDNSQGGGGDNNQGGGDNNQGGGDNNQGGGDNQGGGGDDWEDPYSGPNGPLDNPEDPPWGYQGGYDWNWADFQTGAPSMDGGGGYDPNDYAFDRYVPGQESPWGIPDAEGGNKDFYRNQFVNLLKDEQNFQNKQDKARRNRWLIDRAQAGVQEAPGEMAQEDWENNWLRPNQPAAMDWSWLEGGLPEVAVGGQEDWRLNDQFEGMNNLDVLQQLRSQGDISKTTYDWFRDTWQNQDFDASGTSWWANRADYGGLSSMGNGPAGQAAYQDLADGLFTNYGSPEGVAEGYAAPVQGYNPRRLASGPANSYWNPAAGGWGPINFP